MMLAWPGYTDDTCAHAHDACAPARVSKHREHGRLMLMMFVWPRGHGELVLMMLVLSMPSMARATDAHDACALDAFYGLSS